VGESRVGWIQLDRIASKAPAFKNGGKLPVSNDSVSLHLEITANFQRGWTSNQRAQDE
jgi:hypothetical protein